MNTTAIRWNHTSGSFSARPHSVKTRLELITRRVTGALPAAALALAFMAGAAWLMSGSLGGASVQAALWGSGWVFLLLAIEASGKNLGVYLVTGVGLPALALFSRLFVPELAYLGAAVLAAWLGVGIVQLLRRARA